MDQSYQQTLQREINSRYRRSKKIYKLVLLVHTIKLLLVFIFLVKYRSWDHCSDFTVWLTVYCIIVILLNLVYRLKIDVDPDNEYPYRRLREFELCINLVDVGWFIYGIHLTYGIDLTNYGACGILGNIIFGLILFDIIVSSLRILLNICLCCTICIGVLIRTPVLYNLISYISEPTGMHQNDINLLPLSKYIEIEIQTEPDCPICLMEFNGDDDVRQLNCKHVFHKECIDIWLTLNATCPICRQQIFSTQAPNTENINNVPNCTRIYIQPYEQYYDSTVHTSERSTTS